MSSNLNQHILVAVDYASKFVVVKPTRKANALTVSEFLLNEIIFEIRISQAFNIRSWNGIPQ